MKRVQVLGTSEGRNVLFRLSLKRAIQPLSFLFLCHAPRIHSDCDDQVQRMTDWSPTMSSLLTQLSPHKRATPIQCAVHSTLAIPERTPGPSTQGLHPISCPLTQRESHYLHVDQGALTRLNISVCRSVNRPMSRLRVGKLIFRLVNPDSSVTPPAPRRLFVPTSCHLGGLWLGLHLFLFQS